VSPEAQGAVPYSYTVTRNLTVPNSHGAIWISFKADDAVTFKVDGTVVAYCNGPAGSCFSNGCVQKDITQAFPYPGIYTLEADMTDQIWGYTGLSYEVSIVPDCFGTPTKTASDTPSSTTTSTPTSSPTLRPTVDPSPTVAPYCYNAQWGSAGPGLGQLSGPKGIAVDASQALVYVADTGNNRIAKYSWSGTALADFGGPSAGSGNGQFNQPAALAVSPAGNLIVADTGNARIEVLDKNGVFMGAFGSSGVGNGQFQGPAAVALDASGNIYVSDTGNNRVEKFDPYGQFLSAWGGLGSGNGKFNGPEGIGVDGQGNVYVADLWNHRVQKFSSTGTYLAQWGAYGSGPGQFIQPLSLAVNGCGDIYVGDPVTGTVQIFDGTGNFLGQFGALGSGNGQFNGLQGIALDQTLTAYTVESTLDRVQWARRRSGRAAPASGSCRC
jgi:sugar lactone lactonase YvrE